jgi:ABC-type Zn2+ transport system substrate-binding protein/surface adhesin
MSWARRLLSAILTLAVVQFGALAIAPAHAHEDGASHGVRELSLSHGHAHHGADRDDAPHHHDHDHDADVSSSDDGALPGGNQRGDGNRGDPGEGEHAAHVHGCPQFAPAEAVGVEFAGIALFAKTGPQVFEHIASRVSWRKRWSGASEPHAIR